MARPKAQKSKGNAPPVDAVTDQPQRRKYVRRMKPEEEPKRVNLESRLRVAIMDVISEDAIRTVVQTVVDDVVREEMTHAMEKVKRAIAAFGQQDMGSMARSLRGLDRAHAAYKAKRNAPERAAVPEVGSRVPTKSGKSVSFFPARKAEWWQAVAIFLRDHGPKTCAEIGAVVEPGDDRAGQRINVAFHGDAGMRIVRSIKSGGASPPYKYELTDAARAALGPAPAPVSQAAPVKRKHGGASAAQAAASAERWSRILTYLADNGPQTIRDLSAVSHPGVDPAIATQRLSVLVCQPPGNTIVEKVPGNARPALWRSKQE